MAKAKGFSDVLYLDSTHKKYLEEVSSCNVFVVKVRHLLISNMTSVRLISFPYSVRTFIIFYSLVVYSASL